MRYRVVTPTAVGTSIWPIQLCEVNAQTASYAAIKIAVIVCFAIVAHFLVRLMQFLGDWLIRRRWL